MSKRDILESKFQQQVKNRLKKLPNTWHFTKEAKSLRGLPDIVGVCNGVFFGWELKRSESEAHKSKGRIVLQRHILKLIRSCGGVGELVYPENLDEQIENLQRAARILRSSDRFE
jgi:hypothetical protein